MQISVKFSQTTYPSITIPIKLNLFSSTMDSRKLKLKKQAEVKKKLRSESSPKKNRLPFLWFQNSYTIVDTLNGNALSSARSILLHKSDLSNTT